MSGAGQPITFLKPFANANYGLSICIVAGANAATSPQYDDFALFNPTTTGFTTMKCNAQYVSAIRYYACGMGAEV